MYDCGQKGNYLLYHTKLIFMKMCREMVTKKANRITRYTKEVVNVCVYECGYH